MPVKNFLGLVEMMSGLVNAKMYKWFSLHPAGRITIQWTTLEKNCKKPCNVDLKIAMKILFHHPPTFPFK